MSTVNIVQLAKGAKPTSLTDNFLIKREDVYTDFKTPATRNFFISASSIAAGKETNVTAIPTKITSTLDTTYDTSTSVTGSLSMSTAGQSQAIRRLLKCKNITVVTINMNNQAGQPTTSISVNGQAVTPTTVINIPEVNGSAASGIFSTPAITVSVATSRVPGSGLSNVAATFTKTSQVDVNSQEVIILPGNWQVIGQVNSNSAIIVNDGGSTVGSRQVDGPYVEKDDLLLFIPNLTDNNADIDQSENRFPITGVTIDTSEEFLNRFHGQATSELNAATYLIPARSSGTPTMTLPQLDFGCYQSRPGLLTIGLRWVSA